MARALFCNLETIVGLAAKLLDVQAQTRQRCAFQSKDYNFASKGITKGVVGLTSLFVRFRAAQACGPPNVMKALTEKAPVAYARGSE